MTREELQIEAINLFKKNNNILIQWSTGVGKSKMAIDMINHYQSLRNYSINILLLVAETSHKDNWQKEFEKWGLDSKANIITECYASMKNYKGKIFDIVIADEAHHLGSDLRLSILEEIKAVKFVLLSATLSNTLLDSISQVIGDIATSKVTLQKAIDNNWLPEPKIYLIPLTLDSKVYNHTIIEEWGKKEKRVKFECEWYKRWEYLKYKKTKYPNATLTIRCTAYQKYQYISEQLEYWRKRFMLTRNEAVKNKWLQLGSQRKRFLGECKTNEVHRLIKKLIKDNKRFICFCSSISQANVLGGNNAIHSENENSFNIIEKFNNKKINSIYAVNMLQEGINLKDIEVGIITQLDGQERAFIQKHGRVLRAEDPIQYIFYYKNTRDEEYLEKVLEGIDKSFIKEIKL